MIDSNFLKMFYEIKTQSTKSNFGFEDDWNNFIKKMLILSPKSRGTKIQNRIILKHQFEKISQKNDKGDFKNENQYFEIKTSLIDSTNFNTMHVAGIRTYQQIDGYYIILIDARNFEDIKTYCFFLNNEQMKVELKKNNATALYGTKSANLSNGNVPLRFGIKIDNENFKYWLQNYQIYNFIN